MLKTIISQILKGLQNKSMVLAEDENTTVWLLGAHDLVEDDRDRTKLLAEILKLAKTVGNDQIFGSDVRKLILFYKETQKVKDQTVNKSDA